MAIDLLTKLMDVQNTRDAESFYVECETLDAPNGDFRYRWFVGDPEDRKSVHFTSREAAERAMHSDARECTERGENTVYSLRSVGEMISAPHFLENSGKYQVRKTVRGLNPSLGVGRSYVDGSWIEDSWQLSQGDRFSSAPLFFETKDQAMAAVNRDIESLPKDPESAGFARHPEGVWGREPWIPLENKEAFYRACAHALMSQGIAYSTRGHAFVRKFWERGHAVTRKCHLAHVFTNFRFFKRTEEGRVLFENDVSPALGSVGRLSALIAPADSVTLLPQVKVSNRLRVEYVIYKRPHILNAGEPLEV